MVRLSELWELCHIPDVERTIPREFNPTLHTSHDIKQAQEQVKILEKFLADRAEVYKKFKEWKELWAEKVEFESKANDKSRYYNRGCQLQKALQRQKVIEHRLPIVQRELKEEVEKYEATHDSRIQMDGLTPCEHIEALIEQHKAKGLERKRKKQADASAENLSTVVTPMKRGAPSTFATPCSSAKVAKVRPLKRCSQSASKVR
ncbi:unnamed protein product [Gongylonema pulchrum]|uniref:Uncharacterized protein n=1 Tax=Gongylonema pulchrum TaxID=637853 RepID=A0A3P6Q8S4_9BILA|nr:unnamed protein product [Gongylonema pulchrum]